MFKTFKARALLLGLLLAAPASAEINSIVTLPAGTNSAIQYNNRNQFGASQDFTYSTTTKKLTVGQVQTGTVTINGITYRWPASQTGGYFLSTDGAGGLTWSQANVVNITTGGALGINDGITLVSPYTSSITFNGSQFNVGLVGTSSASVTLDGSSVTLLGPTVDLNTGEVAGILSDTKGGTGINATGIPNGTVLLGNGSNLTQSRLTDCHGANNAITWDASTIGFGCNTISGGSGGGTSTGTVLAGYGLSSSISGSSTTLRLLPNSTSYAQITNSLQSGSTVYLASATVVNLNANGLFLSVTTGGTYNVGQAYYVNGIYNGFFGKSTGVGYSWTDLGNISLMNLTNGGNLNVVHNVTASSLTVSGLISQPCVGTDGSGNFQAGTCSGGGTGPSGAIVASPQYQVGQFSLSGTTTTITGSPDITVQAGVGVGISTVTITSATISALSINGTGPLMFSNPTTGISYVALGSTNGVVNVSTLTVSSMSATSLRIGTYFFGTGDQRAEFTNSDFDQDTFAVNATVNGTGTGRRFALYGWASGSTDSPNYALYLETGTAHFAGITSSLGYLDASGNLVANGPVSLSTAVAGVLPVANGGTGTASPGLVAGTNITSITGTWPNQTINAATQSGGGGGGPSGTINVSTNTNMTYYSGTATNTLSGTNLFTFSGSSFTFSATVAATTVAVNMAGVTATAPIQVGPNNSSSDAQIVVGRNVDNTITGNGHAFADSSNITRNGTIGYNSYDAITNINGTGPYDHYVGFQSAVNYHSTGTINYIYDFLSQATITNTGSPSLHVGFYGADPTLTSSGRPNTQIDFYVPADPTSGASANWGFYSAGHRNFMSSILLGTGDSFYTGDTSPALEINNNLADAKIRFYQNNQNIWDLYSASGTTRFGIRDVDQVEYMSWMADGKVGISTTAPTHLLEVNGGMAVASSTTLNSNVFINSSGTANALQVNAVGNFGTSDGVSGGILASCANPTTQGPCVQIYSNQGVQGALTAPLYLVQNNTAADNPNIYVVAKGTSPQNGIRLDGADYSCIELIDTTRSGSSKNGKFQLCTHNNQMRGERRNPANGAFDSAWTVDSSTGPGIMYVGPGYLNAVSTFDVAGGVSIGAGVAGVTIAPNNGLLVQGALNFQSGVAFTQTYKAAVCQAGTASLGFSAYSSSAPAVSCTSSTNTITGIALFVEGSTTSVQDHFTLPSDWTGAVNANVVWTSTATSGDVVWQLHTTCVADGQAPNQTWNAFATVTDTTKATASQFNTASITSIPTTNCAAGEEMYFELLRDPAHAADTLASTANLATLQLIIRRTLAL